MVASDFNFHVDVPSDSHAWGLLDILESFDLSQHIHSPIHKAGHTLDFLITHSDTRTITKTKISDPCLSEHLAIHFTVSIPEPPHFTKTITYHKTKTIVTEDFVTDLNASIVNSYSSSITDLKQSYHYILLLTLDKHAPMCTMTITVSPECKWFNDGLLAQRREVWNLK